MPKKTAPPHDIAPNLDAAAPPETPAPQASPAGPARRRPSRRAAAPAEAGPLTACLAGLSAGLFRPEAARLAGLDPAALIEDGVETRIGQAEARAELALVERLRRAATEPYEYEEVVTEETAGPDGHLRLVKRKITRRHQPPQVAAATWLLERRSPAWRPSRSRPEAGGETASPGPELLAAMDRATLGADFTIDDDDGETVSYQALPDDGEDGGDA